ncbi:MAG: hypothetical protein QOG68_189, partial [Solirubrobacteraceae bacterium]|nr:hypothetical protein [Solirubrobacteraceae bacterium]
MRRCPVVALACAAALAAAAPAVAAPAPALFEVGAATASINPDPNVPVYAGGFGASPPITQVNDPIEVRAFYVSNGKHAVAMATVDAQAYFSAYQEGPDYGITSVREIAAQEISAGGGPPVSAADIIVQATHTHAGATLEGIWGPVPVSYLQKVHDATVKAIVEAARGARDAHLQMGSYDAPWLDNIDNNQTDSYPGWSQDGQVSVLRAVTPQGAPIASFVSVPAHGDIVEGSGEKKLSADYFGFVRAALDKRLGGINVVGPATLGREETPVQVGGIPVAEWFSGVVTSIVGRALADAHWITDPTVSSANTFTRVAGTNPALLALVAANKLPDAQKMQLWQAAADVQSLYPIDRSIDPPYLTGNVIGTDLTALRIGGNVFLSMPGEPFPEIRHAIADATTGADHIVALSKGQDDWGYFYPAWTWGFTSLYDSDHNIFNIAPQAGDQVILDQAANVRTLGFPVDTAVGKPLPTRFEQALRPGVQAMANPTWGDVGDDGTLPVVFTAIYDAAYAYSRPNDVLPDQARIPNGDRATPVHVDFGDGSSTDVTGDKRTR